MLGLMASMMSPALTSRELYGPVKLVRVTMAHYSTGKVRKPMDNAITYRPHHFMCTLGFEGKGYSSDFVKNFQAIADRLRGQGGDDVVIIVAEATDSICGACPHKRDKLCGSDEEKIQRLDAGHAAALGLKAGDQLTWSEAKRRIAARIDEETFDRICAGCSWKELGVCLTALRKLKD